MIPVEREKRVDWMGLLVAGVVTVGGLWRIGMQIRRTQRASQLVHKLESRQPLYLSQPWTNITFQQHEPGDSGRWRRCILMISHKRVAVYLYPLPKKLKPMMTIQPHELRGFWRPVKYQPGTNEVWLHGEIGRRWLKLRLSKYEMKSVVRALKQIATMDQTTAYRRRRPYIHRGPHEGYQAYQTLHGDWELSDVVELYLMPLYLVVMKRGDVQQVLPIAQMQDITVLKRMEGGEPGGLVRFFIDNEMYAFAVPEYNAWANDLAEAAKRTLEVPLQRKRKSDDDDEHDEAELLEAWEEGDMV